MTGETQDQPGSDREPRQRQRHPATIDLTATEAAAAEGASEQPEQDSAGDPDKTPPDEPSIASEGARSGRLRPAFAGAAAGAGTALVVFGALWAGGFLIRGDRDGAALAALQQQVRELAARPAPTLRDPDPALAQRVSAVETEAKSIGGQLSELGQRLDAASALIREAREASDAALAAARQAPKDAASGASQETGAPSSAQRDIEALQDRLGALEGGVKALQAELGAIKAAAPDAAARRAVLAQSLRAAAAAGQPFAAELAGLKSVSVDGAQFAALEPFAARGLPSAADLRREFDPVGRAILAAADLAPGDRHGGVLERLQASAERLVRVRPVTEGPGQDAPAVVARIQAQLGRGDVAAAFGEVNALPPALRDPAAAWLKHAQARLDGLEAARRLAGEALRALAKDRS